jgi:hypothetical protein
MRHRIFGKKINLLPWSLLVIGILITAVYANSLNTQKNVQKEVSIEFKDVTNDRVKSIFKKVFMEYEILHDRKIILEQKRLKNTTMQAQPVIGLSSFFGNKRRYKITLAREVRDTPLKVSQLPTKVLAGWFAHELGHLVDYEKHSNAGLISFGLKYLTSNQMKKEVEHEADSIAIEHGFAYELIATKKFLLESEHISVQYKDQLNEFYMPVTGVEMCIKDLRKVMPELE